MSTAHPPPQVFTREISGLTKFIAAGEISGLTKFIAAGGCMIYLFVIDTTLINEEAMWPMQYRYDDKRQMNQGMRLIREPNFACC